MQNVYYISQKPLLIHLYNQCAHHDLTTLNTSLEPKLASHSLLYKVSRVHIANIPPIIAAMCWQHVYNIVLQQVSKLNIILANTVLNYIAEICALKLTFY